MLWLWRMTAPRIIVSGATTAITRRTTLRKAFLAPWHPMVSDIWRYALADAQRHTGVEIHHALCVITHHHVTVTAEHDNLPDFTRRFHRDVSCGLNILLIQERYDAPRELFDGRPAHCMRLCDAGAQLTQLVYEQNNCVAAGLVQRPEQMPGAFFDFELWKTGYLDVWRPPVFFDESRPAVIRMRITPPPLLMQAFDGDLDRLVYHIKRVSEHAGQQLRAARKRPVFGARAVERLHPWSEPRSLRERGGERVPSFRIGACGIDGRLTSIAAAKETYEFRREHREKRLARKAGDFGARFPFGTFGMRVHHAAPIEAEPKATALVTKPGLSLAEVRTQLEAERTQQTRDEVQAESIRLLEQARATLKDEAEELVADDEFSFDKTAPSSTPRADDANAPVVRHRFSPRADSASTQAPRRIITLRDARRGRPPGSTRHGVDPPV